MMLNEGNLQRIDLNREEKYVERPDRYKLWNVNSDKDLRFYFNSLMALNIQCLARFAH